MKTILFIVFYLMVTIIIAQPAWTYTNTSGRNLRVKSITYSLDSSRREGETFFTKRPNNGAYGTNIFAGNTLRLDYIAIDDSTKDTVFVRSYSYEEINSNPFVVNLTNYVKPFKPLYPAPKLQIKAKEFEKIMSLGQPIDLKLSDKKTINGFIAKFDNETISIRNTTGETTIINRKDIIGIKGCGPLYAIAYMAFFNHCNYTKLESLRFKVVTQKPVLKYGGETKLEWKE